MNEKEWQRVQNGDYLHRLQRGEVTPSGIAAEIQQLREVFGSPPIPAPLAGSQRMKGNPARDARAELLSFLLTRLASLMDYVVQYRKDVLRDRLLALDDVQAWILQTVDAEGFTPWANVPLPRQAISDRDAHKIASWDEGRQAFVASTATLPPKNESVEIEYRWLEYMIPNQASKQVPTASGGVLERLRLCSDRLAAQWSCAASEASIFILTGHPLPARPCRESFSCGGGGERLGALNRITLNIDPTLSPREVSMVYRRMRGQIFGKRYRAMSEKHIRLALFTWSRNNQNELLRESMAVWNKQYPKWRYRAVSNYGRDSSVASRRAFAILDAPSTSQASVNKWLFGDSGKNTKLVTKKKGRVK